MSKKILFLSISNISLIVFSIIFSLIATELLLRIFGPQKSTLKFYDNDIFGSALVPNQNGLFVSSTGEYKNTVNVNSKGWPDIEHNIEKLKDVKRILIIGDSFVENLQVPFEKRFFRQLQTNLGPKYEIMTMGRGNTGTGPQYLILKNYGLQYKPDLVIHMFFEGNDLKNNSLIMQKDPFLPYFKIDDKGNLIEITQTKRSLRTLAKLKEFLTNFRLVQLILSVRQKIMEENDKRQSGYPVEYHAYDKTYNDEYIKTWEVTKRLILETKKEAENAGSKYILVAIPSSEEVEKKIQDEIVKTYPKFSLENIDFQKQDKILSEFCKKEKITCNFMDPFFGDYENKNQQQDLYFLKDGHWNEVGTNLASQFLTKNLKNYFSIK